jgi:hypothetical protein
MVREDFIKNVTFSWAQWLMPVILATQEVRDWEDQGSSPARAKSHGTLPPHLNQ